AFRADEAAHFRPGEPRAGARKWFADLPAIALARLRALGLAEVSACGLCTASDASRFFSYRRDGLTGRLAAAAWIDPL
ncbi:MAG TPA: laccase domain-containing protein, partial [Burkholderiaceae bacterium]